MKKISLVSAVSSLLHLQVNLRFFYGTRWLITVFNKAWITWGYFTRYSPTSSLAASKLTLSNHKSA